MERNLEIDYLRAYAVLFVVFLHAALELGHSYGIKYSFTEFLSLESGVDIFFAISGYVICEAYHRLKIKHQGFDLYANFIQRRFKRLWPASTFWLSICLLLSFFGGNFPEFHDVLMKFFSGLIYLYNFYEFDKRSNLGFFWSLSVEWQFYIFMPLLMSVARKIRVIFLILLFLLFMLYRPGGEGWWMFRFDGIICVMLAWELAQLYLLRISFSLSERLLWGLFMVLILIEILLMPQLVHFQYLSKSFQCLLSGVLVYLAAQQKGYITDFGCGYVMKWIGLRSYSIYLCHIPLLVGISSLRRLGYLNVNFDLCVFLSFVSILMLSEISYRYVEPAFTRFTFSVSVTKV